MTTTSAIHWNRDDAGIVTLTIDDPDGSLARVYRVAAPPQTYFLDRNGVIQSMQIGPVDEDDFERQYSRIASGHQAGDGA